MIIFFAAICILTVGGGALYFRHPRFKNYIDGSWPSILTDFVIVLIGAGIAILGVDWAFKKETDRNFYDQISSFKNSYYAVMLETSDTLIEAKSLKKEIDKFAFSTRRFNIEISTSVLQNPFIYKFSGNEYVAALSVYSQKVREANQILEFLNVDFVNDGVINEKNLEQIQRVLDKLIYFTHILQYQSQLYVYMYGSSTIIIPPNQNQVLDWIKHSDAHNSDEILAAKAELDKHKDELYRGIWDVWKDIRKMNSPE